MVTRDTATADGFQLMESSDHEKLKWEFPLYSSGPLRTSNGKV